MACGSSGEHHDRRSANHHPRGAVWGKSDQLMSWISSEDFQFGGRQLLHQLTSVGDLSEVPARDVTKGQRISPHAVVSVAGVQPVGIEDRNRSGRPDDVRDLPGVGRVGGQVLLEPRAFGGGTAVMIIIASVRAAQVNHSLAVGRNLVHEQHEMQLASATVVMPLKGSVALSGGRLQTERAGPPQHERFAVIPSHDLEQHAVTRLAADELPEAVVVREHSLEIRVASDGSFDPGEIPET